MQNPSQIKCPTFGTKIDVQDILSHQLEDEIKRKYQQQLAAANIKLDSFIIPNTSYLELQWKGDVSIDDFNDVNVYFQKENVVSYVERILMVI